MEDQQVTSLNPDQKLELRHSKTQVSLQLARWMGHTGQGTKLDVLRTPSPPPSPPPCHHLTLLTPLHLQIWIVGWSKSCLGIFKSIPPSGPPPLATSHMSRPILYVPLHTKVL